MNSFRNKLSDAIWDVMHGYDGRLLEGDFYPGHDAIVEAAFSLLPSISQDGPEVPNDQRVWLARQLLDSRLTDEEAFGIVAYHQDIKDQWKHNA